MLPFAFILGCGVKPTKIFIFKETSNEVFYSVEVWEESGAISSDFTRVFANVNTDGKIDKQLVLDGPYLLVKRIKWDGKRGNVLCLSEGRVNSFRKEVTLNADGKAYVVRTFLDYNCST